MTLTEKLAAEYKIDTWPPDKRATGYQHLADMARDLRDFPKYRVAIVRDTREALAATRDTKDVWL